MVADNILSYDDLRQLFLDGGLSHEHMTESVYEFILDNESQLAKPNISVIEFCTSGLRKYDRYKAIDDVLVFGEFAALYAETAEVSVVAPRIIRRNPKRAVAIAIVAVIGSLFIATLTAAALGYNVIDMLWKAINSPEKTVANIDDKAIIHSNDFRVYNSMSEMLNNENINILYPSELPIGYEFTDFEVTDFDNHYELLAFATEPYIHY